MQPKTSLWDYLTEQEVQSLRDGQHAIKLAELEVFRLATAVNLAQAELDEALARRARPAVVDTAALASAFLGRKAKGAQS